MSPKNRSNDLEGSKFRQQVQSFVCVHPWRRVTFKISDMLKNAAEVTLVPKNIFFLKSLDFVQSFVECKVILADGTLQQFSRFWVFFPWILAMIHFDLLALVWASMQKRFCAHQAQDCNLRRHYFIRLRQNYVSWNMFNLYIVKKNWQYKNYFVITSIISTSP